MTVSSPIERPVLATAACITAASGPLPAASRLSANRLFGPPSGMTCWCSIGVIPISATIDLPLNTRPPTFTRICPSENGLSVWPAKLLFHVLQSATPSLKCATGRTRQRRTGGSIDSTSKHSRRYLALRPVGFSAGILFAPYPFSSVVLDGAGPGISLSRWRSGEGAQTERSGPPPETLERPHVLGGEPVPHVLGGGKMRFHPTFWGAGIGRFGGWQNNFCCARHFGDWHSCEPPPRWLPLARRS